MALTYSKPNLLESLAPAFHLLGVDDKKYSLENFNHSQALLIVFMCNHCPYVQAVDDRLNRLAKKYKAQGLSVVGINPNDTIRYPDDSFEAMKLRSKQKEFVFPYLWDEAQEVAKAYQAVCTPDPYLYKKEADGFRLKYHGRIDDNWKDESQVKTQDLAIAIEALLQNKNISTDQKPSMGCSIKWKASV